MNPAEAPWWAGPLIAGGFTLLGGLLSQLATFFRGRRELQRRWDAELRQLYARYLLRAKLLRDSVVRYSDGQVDLPVLDDLRQVHEELELTAPESVLKSARRLYEAVTDLWAAAARDLSPLPTELFAGYVSAREAFLGAARASLVKR